MNNRDIGLEILDGINEINNFKQGQISLKTVQLSAPLMPKIIHSKRHITQSVFSDLRSVSMCTLQENNNDD